MKIKINNEEIELLYSFRMHLYFENLAQHSLDPSNMNSQDLAYLLYSVICATLDKQNKELPDWHTFLNIVDDNGGNVYMLKFVNWFVEQVKNEYILLEEKEDKDKEEQPVSKKKKKS